METIGSKRSYTLIWCMPNNDDDDVKAYNLSVWLRSVLMNLKH